jgi:hypothetical protein
MKGNPKAAKSKLKRLSMLSDELRENCIKEYFERQKSIFRVKLIRLNYPGPEGEQKC